MVGVPINDRRSVVCVVFSSLLEWVEWFNNRRLLEPIGYLPPAEFEERYYHRLPLA